MKSSRSSLAASAVLALVCLLHPGTSGWAQATQPDNSANNQKHATTADNQSNAASDRETTAKVRRAIIADKDLSLYAHNVKIITQNGAVTLKGPVKSDDEKQKVASDAASVVAAGMVTNQLTVKQ